jgi:outer membrane protein TolC
MVKKVLFTASIICLSMSLKAQSTINLTLQQAKDTAIAYNRTLQNASLDVKKAQAARWQTIASMLPQVSAGYDYQNTLGFTSVINMPTGKIDSVTGQQIIQSFEQKSPAQGNFTITAGLQLSGQQIVGSLINNMAVEMADISKKQTEQTTLNKTTQLYMSALAVQEVVTLLDESKANVDKIFQSTQEAVKVGAVENTEADKLSIQVMKIESAITSAKQNRELSLNALKLHLGIDSDTELKLTDNLNNLTSAETALELLHSNFNINENYNYQLLKQNLKLGKKQIALAAMGYSPSLTFGYRYSKIQYFGGNAPVFASNPPNAISIGVSIPLFTSGRVFEAIQEKKIDFLKTKNSFYDAENGLKIQDKQLRYNLNSAYENFQIQKKNIEVSQRVFNNVSEKFRYGRSSSLEVTQASTDFITAQNSYIQALIDMVNAQVELRNLLNK